MSACRSPSSSEIVLVMQSLLDVVSTVATHTVVLPLGKEVLLAPYAWNDLVNFLFAVDLVDRSICFVLLPLNAVLVAVIILYRSFSAYVVSAEYAGKALYGHHLEDFAAFDTDPPPSTGDLLFLRQRIFSVSDVTPHTYVRLCVVWY
jgi:hypothetical protein